MMPPITLRSCLLVTGIVFAGSLPYVATPASETKPAEQETPPAAQPPAPPTSAPTTPPVAQQAVAPAAQPAAAMVVRIAPGTPPAPECAWTGQRIVQALLRDDVIAADGFLDFYRGFGCPDGHLGRAFGCAVPLANAEAAPRRQQIAACWLDPDSAGMLDSAARAEKKDARADGTINKEPEKSGKLGTPR